MDSKQTGKMWGLLLIIMGGHLEVWGLQIRLDGSSCTGRVQVESEGQWGSVCSHSWDLRDAEVVCKQLGCGAAVSAPHLAHPQTAPEDRVLNKVGCLGNETELGECRAGRLGSKDCQHPWDAGVICAESAEGTEALKKTDEKKIYLTTLANSCAGRVDVFYRGLQGTICEDGWGLNESHVACRQAGCGEAHTYVRMRIPTTDVPIWLDRVHCSGNESTLWECSSDPWGHHECDYNMNVHVVCKGALNFSLQNGNSPCAGRLELKGELGILSFPDEYIDTNVAHVLCKELKCGSSASVNKQAHYGEVASGLWYFPIRCNGNESSFWHCHALFVPRQATPDKSSYAGLVCFDHREPRIVGGEDPCSGRVEVQFGNEWGTLCDSGWDLQDASVVCRQLQCGEAVAIPGGARYGQGKGPVWDKQLDCQGNESIVFECPVSTEKTQNCSHRNYASVVCSGQEGPRLVGGESRCAGRVEVLHGSQWGSLCDRDLEWQTAEVICRHLQCGGVKATPRGAPYGVGSVPLWKDRYQCSGREGRLGDCPVSWGKEECEQVSVASVVCSDEDWLVRLQGTHSRCEGRVEILMSGLWGRVLDSDWDLQDANSVCRILSCGGALMAYISTMYGDGNGPVLLTEVDCKGNESVLQNCSFTLSSGSVNTSGGVGVLCSEHWQVRLAGVGSLCAGRVEVYHHGAWGSVCDDFWDLVDASVVCRQLGCGHALRAAVSAEFGEGSGPVWMDDVNCEGNESALWNCPRQSLEKGNCRHKEDAGVVCSEHKQLRLVSAEYDCAGRLEVLYNGTWGSVCSNGMDSFTIDLICKQLQCGDTGTLQDGQQYESGSGPKWLDNMKCLGQESVLWQCSSSPWGQNECQDSEEAEIQCSGYRKKPETITNDPEDNVCTGPLVRLVGAEGSCSGRVEVCQKGAWGTVCDDSWDIQEAHVICRELGCGVGLSALQEAHFGEGNGTVWLDEVNCRGTERSLLECCSSPPGIHDCTHKEDAAVICSGPDTTVSPLPDTNQQEGVKTGNWILGLTFTCLMLGVPLCAVSTAFFIKRNKYRKHKGLSNTYEAVYEEIDQRLHLDRSHKMYTSEVQYDEPVSHSETKKSAADKSEPGPDRSGLLDPEDRYDDVADSIKPETGYDDVGCDSREKDPDYDDVEEHDHVNEEGDSEIRAAGSKAENTKDPECGEEAESEDSSDNDYVNERGASQYDDIGNYLEKEDSIKGT